MSKGRHSGRGQMPLLNHYKSVFMFICRKGASKDIFVSLSMMYPLKYFFPISLSCFLKDLFLVMKRLSMKVNCTSLTNVIYFFLIITSFLDSIQSTNDAAYLFKRQVMSITFHLCAWKGIFILQNDVLVRTLCMNDRILPPCNLELSSSLMCCSQILSALLIMLSCDGISDHAISDHRSQK